MRLQELKSLGCVVLPPSLRPAAKWVWSRWPCPGFGSLGPLVVGGFYGSGVGLLPPFPVLWGRRG